MRLTSYFLPTLKEDPAEAQIVSHRLMLRAGMIRQSSAGIYSWLPLGYRVLRRIEQIVREEQDAAGCQEMLMPTIQPAELWRESGRYEGYGKEMLRIVDRHDREMLYGPTNEEQITEIFRHAARSYRDLPKLLYHIQWKFRDEVRPRFGVMRGREFLMKDAYSFDIDKAGAVRAYNKMFVAYLRTFAFRHAEGEAVFTHANPLEPEQWQSLYLFEHVDWCLAGLDAQIAFVGHTHYPGIYCRMDSTSVLLTSSQVAIGRHRYLVNVGSVGQPRDGDPRAAYAIYDLKAGTIELRRLEYDFEKTQAKILEAGLPERLANRLAMGK